MQVFDPEDTSMHAGVIYYLHNGDFEPRYIGKTIRPLRSRLIGHLSAANRNKPYAVSKWINRYGAENIQICVIETLDDESIGLIDEREIFHIAQLRAKIGNRCLNLTDGADGTTGYKHTPEAVEKIRAASAARPLPPKFVAAQQDQYERTDAHREQARKAVKDIWDNMDPEVRAARTAKSAGHATARAHVRWHLNRNMVNPDCAHCA